jgi:hypothetical protein
MFSSDIFPAYIEASLTNTVYKSLRKASHKRRSNYVQGTGYRSLHGNRATVVYIGTGLP